VPSRRFTSVCPYLQPASAGMYPRPVRTRVTGCGHLFSLWRERGPTLTPVPCSHIARRALRLHFGGREGSHCRSHTSRGVLYACGIAADDILTKLCRLSNIIVQDGKMRRLHAVVKVFSVTTTTKNCTLHMSNVSYRNEI